MYIDVFHCIVAHSLARSYTLVVLSDFVRSVGNNPSEKTCEEWIKKIGKGDKITFDDCLPAVEEMKKDCVSADDLIEAFKMFDKDGGGYISLAELRHIYGSLGEKFNEQELNEMAEGIDDGTGMVDYQQFAKMLLA